MKKRMSRTKKLALNKDKLWRVAGGYPKDTEQATGCAGTCGGFSCLPNGDFCTVL
jgi:hypothetical protein